MRQKTCPVLQPGDRYVELPQLGRMPCRQSPGPARLSPVQAHHTRKWKRKPGWSLKAVRVLLAAAGPVWYQLSRADSHWLTDWHSHFMTLNKVVLWQLRSQSVDSQIFVRISRLLTRGEGLIVTSRHWMLDLTKYPDICQTSDLPSSQVGLADVYTPLSHLGLFWYTVHTTHFTHSASSDWREKKAEEISFTHVLVDIKSLM